MVEVLAIINTSLYYHFYYSTFACNLQAFCNVWLAIVFQIIYSNKNKRTTRHYNRMVRYFLSLNIQTILYELITAFYKRAVNRLESDVIQSTEEQLLDQFPDCKELLDTYTDALHIETQLECEADFERGFRLGAQIAAEVLKPFE